MVGLEPRCAAKISCHTTDLMQKVFGVWEQRLSWNGDEREGWGQETEGRRQRKLSGWLGPFKGGSCFYEAGRTVEMAAPGRDAC